jgi:hypothetical protein
MILLALNLGVIVHLKNTVMFHLLTRKAFSVTHQQRFNIGIYSLSGPSSLAHYMMSQVKYLAATLLNLAISAYLLATFRHTPFKHVPEQTRDLSGSRWLRYQF